MDSRFKYENKDGKTSKRNLGGDKGKHELELQHYQ